MYTDRKLTYETIARFETINRLFEAIEYLFRRNPKLINFCFGAEKDKLINDPEILLKQIDEFSSQDQILIRIALDLWDKKGMTQIQDILYVLDLECFERVVFVLKALRKSHDSLNESLNEVIEELKIEYLKGSKMSLKDSRVIFSDLYKTSKKILNN